MISAPLAAGHHELAVDEDATAGRHVLEGAGADRDGHVVAAAVLQWRRRRRDDGRSGFQGGGLKVSLKVKQSCHNIFLSFKEYYISCSLKINIFFPFLYFFAFSLPLRPTIFFLLYVLQFSFKTKDLLDFLCCATRARA